MKNKEKLVSIILNCFNGEQYLKEALNSIKNQTYKNWELIFWDNKSTDKSKDILKSFKNKKFKYFIAKKHTSLYEAKNLAIKVSRGEFISFIDADDIWKNKKLELQIKFMLKKNILFSHSSYEIVDDNNKVKGFRTAENYDSFFQLRRSCNIGLSTVIIERKLLSNRFKFPKIKTKEDYVLWLLIIKSGIKIFGLKKKLVKWRKSRNSLSSALYQ